MKLQVGKSPGPDGIPAEFYQAFWPCINNMYLEFVNSVRVNSFPDEKNTSITTIIYKKRGDPYLLINYRPIALMNVDVKILTKLLSIRLAKVLPGIIHESQSAVCGRTIGNTVHLVRDIKLQNFPGLRPEPRLGGLQRPQTPAALNSLRALRALRSYRSLRSHQNSRFEFISLFRPL